MKNNKNRKSISKAMDMLEKVDAIQQDIFPPEVSYDIHNEILDLMDRLEEALDQDEEFWKSVSN